MSDDPFNDMDEDSADEADDDPFDELAKDPADRTDDDPFDDLDDGHADDKRDDRSDREPEATTGDQDHEFPIDEPTDGARKRRAGPGEDLFSDLGTAPDEDAFEHGDWSAGEVDDTLWEDLSTEPETTSEREGERRVSEVNKHSFCEQCEYFTGPPEIACTNDGTDILAFLDMETVRVADCPIVEERERLESGGTRD